MNNRTKKAFIWDLDGTLVDSYRVIVSSTNKILLEYSINYCEDNIYHHVKETSVHHFLTKISSEHNISSDELIRKYTIVSENEQKNIRLIPNAKEILEILDKQGIQNFIYTHRGHSTFALVKDNEISEYFKEIVTSSNEFKRKPDPEALIYLMDKYSLAKENTFYVGDRSLDVACSHNAGIKSILLLTNNINILDKVTPDYAIQNLMEIQNIELK